MYPITTQELVGLCTLGGAAFLLTLFVAVQLVGLSRRVAKAARQRGTLVGLAARVVLTIPEDGVGRVSLLAGDQRIILPARSFEETELVSGTDVVIVELEGRFALVASSESPIR